MPIDGVASPLHRTNVSFSWFTFVNRLCRLDRTYLYKHITSQERHMQDVLRRVMVPIIDHSVCSSLPNKSYRNITGRMFCGGLLEGSKDSCQVTFLISGTLLIWRTIFLRSIFLSRQATWLYFIDYHPEEILELRALTTFEFAFPRESLPCHTRQNTE